VASHYFSWCRVHPSSVRRGLFAWFKPIRLHPHRRAYRLKP